MKKVLGSDGGLGPCASGRVWSEAMSDGPFGPAGQISCAGRSHMPFFLSFQAGTQPPGVHDENATFGDQTGQSVILKGTHFRHGSWRERARSYSWLYIPMWLGTLTCVPISKHPCPGCPLLGASGRPTAATLPNRQQPPRNFSPARRSRSTSASSNGVDRSVQAQRAGKKRPVHFAADRSLRTRLMIDGARENEAARNVDAPRTRSLPSSKGSLQVAAHHSIANRTVRQDARPDLRIRIVASCRCYHVRRPKAQLEQRDIRLVHVAILLQVGGHAG